MKNRKKLLAIALLAFISIGYAVLTSNLNINGVFSFERNSWDIYFDNIQVDQSSIEAITAPTINSTKDTINYSLKFKKPGDFYAFTVDVINDGSVDAMISLLTNSLENENWLEYIITYSDTTPVGEKDLLPAYSKDTFKVIVRFKTNIEINDLPDSKNLNLSISLDYGIADKTVNKTRIVKDLSGNNNNGFLYNGVVVNSNGTVTLDGINDYINTGLLYDYNQDFSIVMRAKFNNVSDSVLLGNYNSSGDGVGLKLSTDNITFSFNEASSPVLVPFTISVNTTDWYTLIAYYNSDDGSTKLYVKPGEGFVYSERIFNGNIVNTNLPMVIGGILNTDSTVSNASAITISDVLIFNRALSDNEIDNDYTQNSINPSNTEGLLVYYDFQ